MPRTHSPPTEHELRVTMSTPKRTKMAEKPPPIQLPPIAPPGGALPNPQDGDSSDPDKLMNKVQGGDRDALGRLFMMYHQRLCAVIRSNCPTGIEDEDIAIETWMRVQQRAGQYAIGTNFFAWLSQIGVNIARDRNRRRHGQFVAEPEHVDRVVSRYEQPGETMAQLREVYDSCLEGLEPTARKIVIFRASDNSNRQVAEYMGLPEPRTSEIFRRAMAQLLECIRGKLS